MRLSKHSITAAGVALATAAAAPAQPAAVFGDHMVLQRNVPVPVWGRAEPHRIVTVRFRDQEVHARTDDGGHWRTELAAMSAGGPDPLEIDTGHRFTFDDVLVGEVWICSGQSNMEWPLERADDGAAEVAGANHPDLRLLHIRRCSEPMPASTFVGEWARCEPETARGFSGVAYFFGRELARELRVPVGLIASSYGGTPAEAWTPAEELTSAPDFAPILDRWRRAAARHDRSRTAGEGEAHPAPPASHRPAGLYHGMIAPVVGTAMRGVIWYQGESNVERAYQYRSLLPALIRGWRRAWGQGDFPFLFAQLANFRAGAPSEWAELREAQLMALSEPNTAMAVTIDIGDPDDIHPGNKQEVGRRLALCALARAYDRDVRYSGPMLAGFDVQGSAIRLRFRHAGGSLSTRDGEPLREFEIATADGAFVPAETRIEGDTVVVSNADVAHPAHVRYAFRDAPDGNLTNAAGLPASPFRTDQRPGVTATAR